LISPFCGATRPSHRRYSGRLSHRIRQGPQVSRSKPRVITLGENVMLGATMIRSQEELLIRQPIDDSLIEQVVDTLLRGLVA
jgi:hypothetical protein